MDLTRLLPGPLATLLLRDLGAEVVKVEDPPDGDPVRHLPPQVAGASPLFHCLNRGKRFVALDLRGVAGRDRLLRLLETADCLVESFRPDVLPRLGLDPMDLVRRYDRLVVVRLSGFGAVGPWAGRPGHDLNYMALSGALDGAPSPWPPRSQVADVGAALLAALAATAAIAGRGRLPPEARVLDVPILDAAMLFALPLHAREAGGDETAPGKGLLEGGAPLYRTYGGADGRAWSLAALEPKFQAAIEVLCGGLDMASIQSAFQHIDATDLADPLASPPCVEPVLSPAEARQHPAVTSRSLFRTMRAGGDEVVLPVTPFAGPDLPDGPWALPLGADDAHVLP